MSGSGSEPVAPGPQGRDHGHEGLRADGAVSTARLRRLGLNAGLTAVGVTDAAVLEPARTVLTIRKDAGMAGSMQFTYRNPERSTDPTRLLASARSLVAGALAYGGEEGLAIGRYDGRVARYMWRNHYRTLDAHLDVMARELRRHGHRAVVVSDDNALVDRNVAWSAGLGWYGKNANLLVPGAGSWFVLGAVVTDAVLEPTGPPVDDGCGGCSRCLDDCPTGAIVAPGVVDATRCLAWLVQAAGPIERRFRVAVGDRLYGCDDCQDWCPPNRMVERRGSVPEPKATERPTSYEPVAPEPGVAMTGVDVRWILSAGDEEILDHLGQWYIADRNVDVIRRTALVVLGNIGIADDPAVERLLVRYLAHREPILRGHAIWAARRLGLDRLVPDPADEPDAEVREEMSAPVEVRPGLAGRSTDGGGG